MRVRKEAWIGFTHYYILVNSQSGLYAAHSSDIEALFCQSHIQVRSRE